jgi:Na+/citrate or Na+/malate symporter
MRTGGVTTISMLVVLIVGTVIGAFVGLVLGGTISHRAVLALVAGLAGTIGAAIVRNALVYRQIGVGPNDEAIPAVVVIYAAIAAIAGSLGGLELARLLHEPSPVWIGTLSGLLSSILMALLMIAYHTP